MEEIESYEPKASEIVELEPASATAYFAETLPETGEAVAVGGDENDVPKAHGLAVEQLGGRRVRLLFIGERPGIVVGSPVQSTGRRAGLELDETGAIDLRHQGIVPERDDASWFPLRWDSPAFSKLRGSFPALKLGYSGLDTIAPVAGGGVNLLIDTSGRLDAARRLFRACVRLESPDATIWAPYSTGLSADAETPDWLDHPIRTGPDAHEHTAGIRTAVALGASLRDSLERSSVFLDLPPIGRTVSSPKDQAVGIGYDELVDRVASGLVSTERHAITTVLRLPVPDTSSGIESIVETLGLGDVDAQIFIDSSGRFAPDRSTSDAELDRDRREARTVALETLRIAERARDKRELLGEWELTERESAAIERATALRDDLTSVPAVES